MGRPDVHTLQNDSRYHKILELEFRNMTAFVLDHIKGREKMALLFFVLNISTALFLLMYLVWGLTWDRFDGRMAFWRMGAGMLAGTLVIIPPHELIHGIAYVMLGARNIRFGADFQQFMFFVTADRFPISRNEIRFLAMAPFVTINVLTIGLTAIWFPDWILFSATLLLSHNIMCIGDFALTSYANKVQGEVYSYDEIENKKSYFYGLKDAD